MSWRSSDSGSLGAMSEHNDQIALGDESSSVKHLVTCITLFSGRFTLLTAFIRAVSHGSDFAPSTTLHVDLGAKAAAEAGNNIDGIMCICMDVQVLIDKTDIGIAMKLGVLSVVSVVVALFPVMVVKRGGDEVVGVLQRSVSSE